MTLFGLGLLLIWQHVATAPVSFVNVHHFNGQYEWNGDKGVKRDLQASMADKGASGWEVKIWYVWDGETYTYEGTLSGKMGQSMAGKVKNETDTYRLALEFVKDHYEGLHFYQNKEGEEETGQIWLYPNTP